MPKQTVLVIEDTDDIRFLIRSGLERDGYHVVEAANAAQALAALKSTLPHVILLDLMLPDENGLNLIGRIRDHTDAPVIVVSAKSNLIERIVGFEAGADDYVAKPFQMQELLARVKAHARRHTNSQKPKIESSKIRKIRFRQYTMDTARLQVFLDNGNSANLTVKEFKLLEVLVSSPKKVFSREQLLDKSRGDDFNVTDRAIDTQITRIRKKLNDDVEEESMIQSARGIGYFFSEDVKIIIE